MAGVNFPTVEEIVSVELPTTPVDGVNFPKVEEIMSVELPTTPIAGDLFSDDDRSIAADSWSVKSEYGSVFDDEQRHADATDALTAARKLSPSFHYSSDKDSDNEDEENSDGITSMLGIQSYWDASYSEELANFRQYGLAGEIWFGPEVMDTVVSWTKSLCIDISLRRRLNNPNGDKVSHIERTGHDMSSWSVLDLGTGNGLLLQEFAKHGFYDLTGVDYSEGAINLACALADRDGFLTISFLVDDFLETKLKRQFQLVMDKGTLDVIGLHPDGPVKRLMYWDSVSKLVSPGGILVITSCSSTKDELVREVENVITSPPCFQYMDHVKSYPTFMFGGVFGSRVATVAFMRN